ncbi:MAG: hypothetical protein GY710_26095 [Desulfobacteraceae bacterium]|nr:hypothetical protein [Desulfobacteraceae bacterium]
MNLMELIIDGLGWSGAIALIFAYILVSNKKIKPNAYVYQFLNLWGAFGLSVNALYYGALPSVGLNVIWLAIGLFMLHRIWKDKNKDMKTKKEGS